MNGAAREMATGSSQLMISANDLQKLAGRLNQTVSRFRTTAERFDIGKVKHDHLRWRTKLEGMLHGGQTLTAEEVGSHTSCAFGKWYQGSSGLALKDSVAFATVGRHHEKVHDYARQIVQSFEQGDRQSASTLMQSFEKEREQLFEALDELYLV